MYTESMSILKPTSIDEYIVHTLQKKSMSGADLLKTIQRSRPHTTKQALYAALRKLKKDEIVVMNHMMMALSSVWVIRMADFFQTAKYMYTKTTSQDDGFLNLKEGEKISYSFADAHTADMFWGHAFHLFTEIFPIQESLYIYNPHEWFILARAESEKALFNNLSQTGRNSYILVGSKEFIDLQVAREFNQEKVHYHATKDNVFEKRNYYVNSVGDFIIEAYLDEDITDKVDFFYQETKVLNKDTRQKLQEMVTLSGKTKLIISRNQKKAAKLQKMIGNYFHF
jgi:hypothetical protein